MRKLKHNLSYTQRWPINRSLKVLKFNRKKWFFLKKLVKSKSLDSINSSSINFTPLFDNKSRFPTVIRKRLIFKNNLLLLNRLRHNDISLKKYQLKSLFYKNRSSYEKFLVDLNSRLDMILYKTRLFSSISSLNQFLRHEGVFVNNKRILNGNYLLKEGDIITFNPKKRLFYKKYFQKFLNIRIDKIHNVLECDFDIFTFIVKNLESDVLLKSVYSEFHKEVFWTGRLFK